MIRGTVVKLKGQGISMTVIKRYENSPEVVCVWFNSKGELETHVFFIDTLYKIGGN